MENHLIVSKRIELAHHTLDFNDLILNKPTIFEMYSLILRVDHLFINHQHIYKTKCSKANIR